MNQEPRTFEEWFEIATRGLAPRLRQRLHVELSAHFEEALRELAVTGLGSAETTQRALSQLGRAAEAAEVFREEYGLEQPWERDFLPGKPEGSGYGYLKGSQLVACSREELVRKIKDSWKSNEQTDLFWMVWTPDTERLVRAESIPFLFDAIRDSRKSNALFGIANMAIGCFSFYLCFREDSPLNPRHVAFFVGIFMVLAWSCWRDYSRAKKLTAGALGGELFDVVERSRFWMYRQTSRLGEGLAVACLIVSLGGLAAASASGGSHETASLLKPALVAGEWWRLLTCVFLSTGTGSLEVSVNMMVNIIGLAIFGRGVEVLIGAAFVPVVFLFAAISGSLASLGMSVDPSIGSWAGTLGLAGFLFACARPGNGMLLPQVSEWRWIVVRWAGFAVLAGVVVYDMVNNAANLGGLLAGLLLGYAIKQPGKLATNPWLRRLALVAIAMLIAGALGAIALMLIPVPKIPA